MKDDANANANDAAIAQIAEQRKKREQNIKRATLFQEATAVLMDRFTTRAVNDRDRTGPLPTPDDARKAVARFVPALVAEAGKLRAADATLSAHDAFNRAAEAMEAAESPSTPAPSGPAAPKLAVLPPPGPMKPTVVPAPTPAPSETKPAN